MRFFSTNTIQKATLFAIGIFLGAIGYFWYQKHTSDKSFLHNYYQTMIAFHTRSDPFVPPKSVLFFGDSHIQGLSVISIVPQGVNYGIGGDTVRGLIKRLGNYRSLFKAKAIVVAIGYNDFKYRPLATIRSDIQRLIAKFPKDIPLYLHTVFPVDEKRSALKGINSDIAMLNETIRNVCATTPSCIPVDFASLITDENASRKLRYDLGDGVHLNTEGYRLWIKTLQKLLAR